MVLQPRLLLVYVAIFLAVNPDNIPTQFLAGKTPQTEVLKEWLPKNKAATSFQSPNMIQEDTAVLQFDDQVIDKLEEKCYAEQMEELVRFIGKKHTKIVFRVSNPKFERKSINFKLIFHFFG